MNERRTKKADYLLIDGLMRPNDPASIRQFFKTIKQPQKLLAIFGLLIHRYVAITSITG
jgi:hypothetical protein